MAIKTTIITGATSGIGRETALALAQKDHAVYMLVRNVEKGESVRDDIIMQTGNKNVFVIACNLADMQSVKKAANILKEKLFAINVLINNAGGIFDSREESNDGIEMTFAVNHLAHFLLTLSLMPLLEKGQARIINVSSEAHRMARPDLNDVQQTRKFSRTLAYANAKLFNIYFTKSLAEKYKAKGITAFSLHPGMVDTAFGESLSGWGKTLMLLARPFMISAKKGAQTSIYLATAPKLDSYSGAYFKRCKRARPAASANNKELQAKLWEVSSKLVDQFL